MALSEEVGQVGDILLTRIGRALSSLDRVEEAEELLLRINQSLFRYFQDPQHEVLRVFYTWPVSILYPVCCPTI